jgi:hypothetical protein
MRRVVTLDEADMWFGNLPQPYMICQLNYWNIGDDALLHRVISFVVCEDTCVLTFGETANKATFNILHSLSALYQNLEHSNILSRVVALHGKPHHSNSTSQPNEELATTHAKGRA